MKYINRRVLLILVMLKLLLPVALVAAANETAVTHLTRSFSQTAVLTILNQFAEPDCPPTGHSFRQLNFDMAQPLPDCWLLTGQREIQIE